MTKADKKALREWAGQLSNDALEQEYYAAVFSSLGSEAEEMYERGYDLRDIYEREKFERDLIVKSHILEELCVERGIKLWKDGADNG